MNFICPEWPVPAKVRSLITTRHGGVSLPPFDTFNLGIHVGDEAEHVMANRKRLLAHLPDMPKWLNQVHGRKVVDLDNEAVLEGDAAFTRKTNVVCAILTADCLPVLFSGKDTVGAAHAGWRGLAAGILEETVLKMGGAEQAYLGPAIGQNAFEVGEEVLEAFPGERSAFVKRTRWHADLYRIARMKLESIGVKQIHGGNYCTFDEASRFYSYRREGKTGRIGSFIWLED